MVGPGGRSLPLSLNALQAGASRFTLLLTGSAGPLLADGVANIAHAGFGSQRLSIACYGVGEGAARYRIESARARLRAVGRRTAAHVTRGESLLTIPGNNYC